MKINLYDTTGRWWEMADVISETVAMLIIRRKTEDLRDSVRVYPIDENGTYYGGAPIYLLNEHIVAYEVIGRESEEE